VVIRGGGGGVFDLSCVTSEWPVTDPALVREVGDSALTGPGSLACAVLPCGGSVGSDCTDCASSQGTCSTVARTACRSGMLRTSAAGSEDTPDSLCNSAPPSWSKYCCSAAGVSSCTGSGYVPLDPPVECGTEVVLGVAVLDETGPEGDPSGGSSDELECDAGGELDGVDFSSRGLDVSLARRPAAGPALLFKLSLARRVRATAAGDG
jgi:hypothetical protein